MHQQSSEVIFSLRVYIISRCVRCKFVLDEICEIVNIALEINERYEREKKCHSASYGYTYIDKNIFNNIPN